MKKQNLINEILGLMIKKGYFKENDFNYNIYKNLMKTDTIKDLNELKQQILNEEYILY